MLPNSGVSFKNSKWDRIVLATDPVRRHTPRCFRDHNGKTFLQFEVHRTKSRASVYKNDDYRSTLRKLAAGLAEQLRCLRQADVDTTEIVGYYFFS